MTTGWAARTTSPWTARQPSRPWPHTAKILAEAAALLDLRQPVAVLLIGVLQLIPDQDDPHAIVTRLMKRGVP